WREVLYACAEPAALLCFLLWQQGVDPWAEALQPQAVSGPGPRGACHRGGETLPHRERSLAQHQGTLLRLGNGCRLRVAQSPRSETQTQAATVRNRYSA